MRAKRFLGILIAAALLGTSLPAVQAQAAAPFSDSVGHWAESSVRKMSLKGVLQGTGAGRFEPARSVSRLELTVMLVRAEGLETEARASTQSPTSIVGYQQMPVWSWGYLNYAVALSLIDDEDALNFRPNDPALRYQVAVMMVRALGLESEAKRITTTPSFSDAYAIPQWARGYVSLAATKGLFKGDAGGAFRPLDTVTRGEMAALLDRLDRLQSNRLDTSDITGKIKATTSGAYMRLDLTLSNGNSSTLYPNGDTWIIRDGVPASFASLEVGDDVQVLLDAGGSVAYVEATEPATQAVTGTLAAPLTSASRTVLVTVQGKDTSYTLVSPPLLHKDGKPASFDDLWVGDRVTLTLAEERVTEISATSVTRTVRGILTSIIVSATNPAIGVTVGSAPEQVFQIPSSVSIKVGTTTVDITDLTLGAYVDLSATGSRATRVSVSYKEVLQEISGVILSVNATRTEITLSVTDQLTAVSGSPQKVVKVPVTAMVIKHSAEAVFADLKPGDRVFVAGQTVGGVFTAKTVVVTFTDRPAQ